MHKPFDSFLTGRRSIAPFIVVEISIQDSNKFRINAQAIPHLVDRRCLGVQLEPEIAVIVSGVVVEDRNEGYVSGVVGVYMPELNLATGSGPIYRVLCVLVEEDTLKLIESFIPILVHPCDVAHLGSAVHVHEFVARSPHDVGEDQVGVVYGKLSLGVVLY